MNTENHFELTDEYIINSFGIKLFRIKCTRKIKEIEIGTLGGFVEKMENLSGDAWVSGNAEVSGNALVFGDADYCCFQSFGRSNRTTTVFREKKNKIKVNCGCFSGTLEEFEQQVEKTHGDSQFGKEYKAIIDVVKVKFNLK